MARIHRITNQNSFLMGKVNYFADYFAFAVETAGVNDVVEIENPLSVVDKIIFQLTKNPIRCIPYLDNYLTHESFSQYEHFKKFKSYQKVQRLVKEYQSQGKAKNKFNWISSKPDFLQSLKSYRKDLKRDMFKKSLKSVISYLLCIHPIDDHKKDLFEQTNILVSEFIHGDRSKKDIAKVFERIIPREIGTFPFPRSLKSLEEKEDYLTNRTFEQQFNGIYDLLREKLMESYILFRVYGLKVPDSFEFTYNKVTFLSPKHPKLTTIISKIKEDKYNVDFLNNEKYLIFAVVKSEFASIDIAINTSVETISSEIKYVNKVYGSNCTLEKFSYLLTSNFNDLGYSRNSRDNGRVVEENEIKLLDDNPYIFLRKCKQNLRDVIWANESIYLDALTTQNPATYWQYLETIIPTNQNDEKQIIDIVSKLLLLNAESYHKGRLRSYLIDALSPFNSNAEHIGISQERQFDIFRNPNSVDWDILATEITHPFVSHIVNQYLSPLSKKELEERERFYRRVLWDAQAQRNAIIHKGFANEKALTFLNGTLPRLVTRLRWVLFNGIRDKTGTDYNEIVSNLHKQATALLQGKN